MGKAKAAASKVFGMMDLPSKINAVEQKADNTRALVEVDAANFKG